MRNAGFSFCGYASGFKFSLPIFGLPPLSLSLPLVLLSACARLDESRLEFLIFKSENHMLALALALVIAAPSCSIKSAEGEFDLSPLTLPGE
jgi:hypothetical protein